MKFYVLPLILNRDRRKIEEKAAKLLLCQNSTYYLRLCGLQAGFWRSPDWFGISGNQGFGILGAFSADLYWGGPNKRPGWVLKYL